MRKGKQLLAILAMISLLAVYGAAPVSNAASLANAKDTLSDSDLGVAATHTIVFTTNVALAVNDYFEVTLPAPFGNITVGAITCPASSTSSAPTTETARCTATGPIATGSKTILLTGITNPVTAGSQSINVASRQNGGALNEAIDVAVAIIDNLDVSASVSSALTFEIRPLATSTNINGANTTRTSATTSLAFGTLTVASTSIMGQELRVSTNAKNGYVVTVQQNQNLLSSGGADIDSFVDGTSTAPQAWAAPSGLLDAEWTYGHFGFTSDDGTLTAGDYFGNNLWKGFVTTTPVEVMMHTGPSDGSTQDKGMAKVGYRIEITALQETGDYSNILTYIATPTY